MIESVDRLVAGLRVRVFKVSGAAALERCACSRVQMDVACGVWVPVGSGRPQDELWPDSEVVDEKSKVAHSSLALGV